MKKIQGCTGGDKTRNAQITDKQNKSEMNEWKEKRPTESKWMADDNWMESEKR